MKPSKSSLEARVYTASLAAFIFAAGFVVGVIFTARWAREQYCPSIIDTLIEERTHVELEP